MSTSPRRKAERYARLMNVAAPPEAAPTLAIGVEMVLINQALINLRIRADVHAGFDQYEARMRASEENKAELLAAPDRWCRELVSVWHDIAAETIKAGNMTLGLTQHSIGTTVTRDRFELLVRDLTAERTARDEAPPRDG